MDFRMMVDCVRHFHEHNGVSAVQPIEGLLNRDDLSKIGDKLCKIGDDLEKLMVKEGAKDMRVLRLHLLIEELGETTKAIASGDEVETLDGLADLLYVLLGSAVTMDLPLGEAFEEVHRSNMTKSKQPSDPSSERLRSKGPGYKAPDIAGLLRKYREGTIGRSFKEGITLKDRIVGDAQLGRDNQGKMREPEAYEHIDRDGRIVPDRDSH